jgi:hypothetical protein
VSLRSERDRLYAATIGLAAFLALACVAASGASFQLDVGPTALAIIMVACGLLVLAHELMLWRVTLPQLSRTLRPRSVDMTSIVHGIFPAAVGLLLALVIPHWWAGLPFVGVSIVTLVFLWGRKPPA